MSYFELLQETYFGLFIFMMGLLYGAVMIIIMFYARVQAYDHYLETPVDRPLPFREWALRYEVGADPQYLFIWSIASRAFSTIHAIVMVVTVSHLISDFGIAALWKYNFYLRHPDGMETILNLNAFMMAYLITDVSFLIAHRLQLPANVRTDDNFVFAVIHHLIGAISMLQFIETGQVHFNSLYYSFTEISTITLNVAWLAVKLGWDQHPELRKIYEVAGFTTWLLFLFVRIIGSVALITHLYVNLNSILQLSWANYFFAFGANSIVIGLNFYWFYKLTVKAFEPPVLRRKEE